MQGAYYRKNFGKHGPLHNPYAYGFFEHLPYNQAVAGPRPGGTVYLGDTLPVRFQAPCSAATSCSMRHRGGDWWRIGSTFRANYGGRLLDSRDSWFCAPDLRQGPDGSVIISDFHDDRTAHPDPEANWDRSNGRIYRVAPPGTISVRGLDIGRKTGLELVELLRHPNGWYAEQARVQFANRHDQSTWPALIALACQTDNARLALQGLWGLYVSGGFNDTVAADLLRHPGECVAPGPSGCYATTGRFPPLSPAPCQDGGGRPERNRPLPTRRLGASSTRSGRAANRRVPALPRPRP